MKIDVNSEGHLRMSEVFSGVEMRTADGHSIGICMRDDGFEINICPDGKDSQNWWFVSMKDGNVTQQASISRLVYLGEDNAH